MLGPNYLSILPLIPLANQHCRAFLLECIWVTAANDQSTSSGFSYQLVPAVGALNRPSVGKHALLCSRQTAQGISITNSNARRGCERTIQIRIRISCTIYLSTKPRATGSITEETNCGFWVYGLPLTWAVARRRSGLRVREKRAVRRRRASLACGGVCAVLCMTTSDFLPTMETDVCKRRFPL